MDSASRKNTHVMDAAIKAVMMEVMNTSVLVDRTVAEWKVVGLGVLMDNVSLHLRCVMEMCSAMMQLMRRSRPAVSVTKAVHPVWFIRNTVKFGTVLFLIFL